jgi:hypothetical protein
MSSSSAARPAPKGPAPSQGHPTPVGRVSDQRGAAPGRPGHDRQRRRIRACCRQSGDLDQRGRPVWEAEAEHQDYLQRYPNGYAFHFPRPGWNCHTARPPPNAALGVGPRVVLAGGCRRGAGLAGRSAHSLLSPVAARSVHPTTVDPSHASCFVASRAAHTLMQRGRRRRGPRGASGPASDRSAASNAKWTPPSGTGGHPGAQIEEKRTQFATIVPSTLRRENVRNCRDYAAVREIQAHD